VLDRELCWITVNEIYPTIVKKLLSRNNFVPSRNGGTYELHPYFGRFGQIRKKYVSSIGRMINLPFALAETVHILSGNNKVDMLKFYNSNIPQYSDNGIVFNAPYGERMVFTFEVNQFEDVLYKLLKDKESRQAVIIYSDPFKDNVGINTKDRACNISSLFLIRDNKLDLTQTIRSNDVLWGLPYNFIQFTTIQEIIADFLDVEVGDFYLLSNSLHLYEKQLEEAKLIRPFDIYDYFRPYEIKLPIVLKGNCDKCGKNPQRLACFFQDFANLERSIRNGFVIDLIQVEEFPIYKDLPVYWQDLLKVFLSYYYWKNKETERAIGIAGNIKGIFYPLLMKNYYQWRIRELGGSALNFFWDYFREWISPYNFSDEKLRKLTNWVIEEKNEE